MNKLAPVVLYCHGLGATVRDGIALEAKKFVESRGLQFKSIQYRDSECIGHIWNVDNWLQDLLVNINECTKRRQLCILFGWSAGCHCILRATLLKPKAICGLMLLSPGVGLNLKSYINAIMPQYWDDILADKNVPHPTFSNTTPKTLINRQCLQHFADTCVSNQMKSIAIHCPVRIMHGSDDKVVPLRNVRNFKSKLESNDVILSVINGMGHYLSLTIEFEELFDSLLQSVYKSMERMNGHRFL
uniref:Serine aminopeptidase S33 domain-containing protein n=1 Tax=Setaria digitata TaxID=48799 RepID=A0A915PGR3_9BILA